MINLLGALEWEGRFKSRLFPAAVLPSWCWQWFSHKLVDNDETQEASVFLLMMLFQIQLYFCLMRVFAQHLCLFGVIAFEHCLLANITGNHRAQLTEGLVRLLHVYGERHVVFMSPTCGTCGLSHCLQCPFHHTSQASLWCTPASQHMENSRESPAFFHLNTHYIDCRRSADNTRLLKKLLP